MSPPGISCGWAWSSPSPPWQRRWPRSAWRPSIDSGTEGGGARSARLAHISLDALNFFLASSPTTEPDSHQRESRGGDRGLIWWRTTPASIVSRDRTVVGRRAIGKIKRQLIDIAPAPPLRRIVTFDDRMSGRVIVLGGVLARRLIAAADVPACTTNPQVEPSVACFQTFFAPQRARGHIANAFQMRAALRHDDSPRG